MSHGGEDFGGGAPQLMTMVDGILEVVSRMQNQQDSWNKEMHRLFLVEEKQQQESDRLTERVHAEEAMLNANDVFNKWMSSRADLGIREDMIQGWYHIDALVEKTPFTALAPWPCGLSEKGQREAVEAVDALGLSRFVVQSVPLHLPLSKLAPTFLSSPFHLDEGRRTSKSSIGALSYAGVPCTNGDDVLRLISEHPILLGALSHTPCLFFNDHVPRTALCLHCVTVGGLCVAAEVACDTCLAAKLGLHGPTPGCELSGNSIDVLSHALKQFVEEQLVCSLGKRSFRTLLLGEEVAASREVCKGSDISRSTPADIRFFLLNMDSIDGCEFECFTQEEILALSKNMAHQRHVKSSLLPTLRFLHPQGVHFEAINGGWKMSKKM